MNHPRSFLVQAKQDVSMLLMTNIIYIEPFAGGWFPDILGGDERDLAVLHTEAGPGQRLT